MATYAELIEKANELMRQAEEVRQQERKGAIEKIKAIMAESGLSIQDIVGRKASTSNATSGANKIAPKYRNSATGETWTGRGKRPKWVVARLEAGENLESMLIQQPGTQGA